MESLRRLVKDAERGLQRAAQGIVASTLRCLSDTSRIHVMIVQGDVVFETLCSLEPRDSKGMQRAMRLCELDARNVLVRTRVFGEYALTLAVLEWPLHPSEETTKSLFRVLLEMLTRATSDQRRIDGITLVVDESAILLDPNFYSCFVKTYNQLEMVGHRPIAVVQHCTSNVSLPFNVLHFDSDFITSESLHQLLSKKG